MLGIIAGLTELIPVMIIVIIFVGRQIAGLWSIILGPPLAAAAAQVVKYFYREWDRQIPPPGPEPEVEEPASEERVPVPGDEAQNNRS